MSRSQTYVPSTTIRTVPGVERSEHPFFDEYSGTLEALVQAGIAEAHMFPGQPGRPNSSATYRPAGCTPNAQSCWRTPGYLTIHRAGHTGRFRARLTIATDEQEARLSSEEKARRQFWRNLDILLSSVPEGEEVRLASDAVSALRNRFLVNERPQQGVALQRARLQLVWNGGAQ